MYKNVTKKMVSKQNKYFKMCKRKIFDCQSFLLRTISCTIFFVAEVFVAVCDWTHDNEPRNKLRRNMFLNQYFQSPSVQ